MKGLPKLVIGDLKVKRPVIQGGMGVGVSLGQLAGAVAKEGGVGIISTAQIGFREPDFETNTRAANIRAIGSEFQRARETAPDGVIGFNIMVATRCQARHVACTGRRSRSDRIRGRASNRAAGTCGGQQYQDRSDRID